jgi:hypothetical protein
MKEALARYICKEYNQHHTGEERLKASTGYLLVEMYEISKLELAELKTNFTLWDYPCPLESKE